VEKRTDATSLLLLNTGHQSEKWRRERALSGLWPWGAIQRAVGNAGSTSPEADPEELHEFNGVRRCGYFVGLSGWLAVGRARIKLKKRMLWVAWLSSCHVSVRTPV